ncbi:MAG: chemotaxis protein CheW [Candidatus Endonucleobacter bathymodioli]|uniref:Chemotaxis protein CheW n=1 Tax=Candidatus Endonucleibacter bathymodioli TaxID=539814 RepID=A0AA90SNF4_9GAMM|nr:chemotaxis protein CheW [Candidatus Endonucleobacter bathymodioli]
MITLNEFDLLARLEEKASSATYHFSKEGAATYWTGVKFHLNNEILVVDSREISEILLVPDTVPLPNVKTWVQGVANIRGSVIPIFDLGVFLGGSEEYALERRRVMLVEKKNIIFGLVVDDVLGVVQFPSLSSEESILGSLPPIMRPFISGCCYKDISYMVFSTDQLVENQRFISVSE